MSEPVILLIEPDAQQAAAVARAIEGTLLRRPMHVTSGEAAILWLTAHEAQVCVLDYDLPGISGLETMARIHQRRPGLPVVMMSSEGSEQVAIDAFHAGVADYVPKRANFPQAVAHLVAQIARTGSTDNLAPLPVALPDVADALLQPNYQNRLRVIGRQLDLYGYRGLHLLEVAGGFLVRATPAGGRTPEALEFPDRDFAAMVASAVRARGEGESRRSASPLLPSGYEDFLRAAGWRLDQRHAEAITVAELEGFVAVGGAARVEGYGETALGPFQWLWRGEEIAFVLDEAWHRRGSSPQAQQRRGGLFAKLTSREDARYSVTT